ncbi:MAG: DNA replication and repair protein RecF [Haliscomenobacter sp.]|nr:DNA replication and repair protein RecF [Haliscomenobacter sp.]
MFLNRLLLTQFKNYAFQDISLSPGFNCLFGHNGMGKTNLLDAVYFLCMTKSHFGLPDSSVIQWESEFMRLEGHFILQEKAEKIVAKVAPKKVKTLERQGVPYERLSDHIGLLPIVFIAPDDTELLTEGSETRRRFMDNTLSQLNPVYLRELLLYNRILLQRNALLRQMAESHKKNTALLDVYSEQLIKPGQYVFEQRKAFAAQFSEIFLDFYRIISNQAESAGIRYQSALSDHAFGGLLQQNLDKDLALQRTSAGIHRDDLECLIEGMPVKKFASQGQRKSYLIALKLAQYELLRTSKGVSPILLLDDLFDKLDPQRTAQLLELLGGESFGQIFITDTQAARVSTLLPSLSKSYRLFEVQKGGIQLIAESPSN